jgi:endonuclease/exonuclease/phosphatase family metal-dependent hydrolase
MIARVRWTIAQLAGIAVSLSAVFAATPRVEASTRCTAMPVMHGRTSANDHSPAKDVLTIASLNIAGHPQIADALLAWTRQRGIDVLLLQEVGHASTDGGAFTASLSERLGFHFAYAAADRIRDAQTQGLAIVSRYPLDEVRADPLAYHRLRFRSRCRIALAASVTTGPNGPLRLVNVHLDTRINSHNRVTQLEPVLDALDGLDGPHIIGGDFNTMNIGWFRTMWPFPYLQHQSAAVRALMTAAGFHTPFTGGPPTFRFLGIPLRLDWLYLKRLTPLDWSVDAVRFTDHRGVWVRAQA